MRSMVLVLAATFLSTPALAQEASPTATRPEPTPRRPHPVLEGGNGNAYVSETSFDLLPTAGGAEWPDVFPGRPWTRPQTRMLVEQVFLSVASPLLAIGSAVALGVGAALWAVPVQDRVAASLRDAAGVMTMVGIAPGLAILAVASGVVTLFSGIAHSRELAGE